MEGLKIIPQAFFTLIARVVPGATAIVVYLWLFDKVWETLLFQTFGEVIGQNAIVSILIFLGGSLVAGELISHAAKQVQRIGEWKIFNPKPEAEKGIFDKLRLEKPEAGGLCAKIRAEFTMHNGLAIVFLFGAISYPFTKHTNEILGSVIFFLLALYEGIRGRFVRDTFNSTVEKFAKAANLKTM